MEEKDNIQKSLEYDSEQKNYLNDLWSVYYHDDKRDDWSISSYIRICDISSIEEFIIVFKVFEKEWCEKMFFIMREGINPNWEDEQNINGGCYSYKCNRDDACDKWFDLFSSVLGETFSFESEHSSNINGISINPKKNSNILKIWMRDNKKINKEYYNFNTPKFSTIMYKKHN